MEYRKRTVDLILEKKLLGKGAVVIEGPKWCGKTTTAEQVAKSVLYMATPNKVEQNRSLAEINPQLLLQGASPLLIDEWQIAPKFENLFSLFWFLQFGLKMLIPKETPLLRSKSMHLCTFFSNHRNPKILPYSAQIHAPLHFLLQP